MSSSQRLQNAEPSENIENTFNQTAKVHRESVEDRRPSCHIEAIIEPMSSSQQSQNAEPSKNIKYTVNQTAKVHRDSVEDRRPSIWYSVVKWIVGIFLLISVLSCLVASKISLLSIAYYHESSGAKQSNDTNRETIFIMVVLTLMLPEAVSFLKACWTSLFRKNHKWPSSKAILLVSPLYREDFFSAPFIN